MRLAALLLFSLAALAAPATAQSPVLVELFASKNCRSCPAAYRNVRTLDAEREDILLLTWPVDYWDYLGSKDKMALPESKDRQRGYVERFSLRGAYTPQAVINGAEQAPGNKAGRLISALDRALDLPDSPVTLAREAGRLTLEGDPGGLADVWWVSYLADTDNTKSDMPHPVTSVRQIGPWLGGRADIDLPDCASGCMLIVQKAGFGRVLAAADIR